MGDGGDAAFDALATGGLRGSAGKGWDLFELAWPELERRLSSYLRSLGVSEDFREDCGQATLLRVWRARKTYRGSDRDSLGAWIYRIAQRESLRLGAAKTRTRSREVDLEPEGSQADRDSIDMLTNPTDDPTLDAAVQKDEHGALDACLGRLDTRRRSIVELLYSADGHTEREVAALLGLGKSTVHDLRRDALERLAQCLQTGEGAV